MEMPGDATKEENQANEKVVHGLDMVTIDLGSSDNGFE
jgi:hypothetical protein